MRCVGDLGRSQGQSQSPTQGPQDTGEPGDGQATARPRGERCGPRGERCGRHVLEVHPNLTLLALTLTSTLLALTLYGSHVLEVHPKPHSNNPNMAHVLEVHPNLHPNPRVVRTHDVDYVERGEAAGPVQGKAHTREQQSGALSARPGFGTLCRVQSGVRALITLTLTRVAGAQVVERHVKVELQLLLLRRVEHDARLLIDAEARRRSGTPATRPSGLRLRPAAPPEAPLKARPRLRLPRASASLGQPAAWAALAGRAGPASDMTGCREV
eukprot:scaffold41797_cov66-Phaeocystis_antarctica.AAC.1